MGFFLPYIFNPDQGNLGAKTGFVYGVMSVIAAVISWLFIPEMKGRDWTEIDAMFLARIRAREFEKFGREVGGGGGGEKGL